jgi:hypothetical protein
MPEGNLTLYAVWAAKTPVTLTANSATYAYNGNARSVSGISASVGSLTIENTTAGATGRIRASIRRALAIRRILC